MRNFENGFLQHYGVKGMKWGVRRHRRREERIAKAEASGNKRKAERLRRQRAKVEQYRTPTAPLKMWQ